MSRPTPRGRRLQHLSIAAASLATALSLTACGGSTGAGNSGTRPDSSSATPAPAGVVTPKAAAAVVDAYERANNQANKRRDAALLSTVEAGQVNEQSRADYKTFKTWSAKDKKKYGTPFFYTDRQYLIPAKGTASWFAVKTNSSGDAAKASDDNTGALLIFDRVGSVYKLVFAMYADETPIPKVAVDRHGLAAAVAPSQRLGTLAPSQLGDAFDDLLETGGKKQGADLAVTKATKEATKTYRTRDQDKNSKWATTRYFAAEPAHSKVYALRLASGGVLAVFPMAHTCEVMLRPQYRSGFQIGPSKEEAVYDSRKRTVITDEYQGQALAVLEPSSKPKVIAREYRMVDSR